MKKFVNLGMALFFFALGCAVTSFFSHGEMPQLASVAIAGGDCVTVWHTDQSVSGNQCHYTIEFNKKVEGVTTTGSRTVEVLFGPCLYNCEMFNPASGTCIGPAHDWCE